MVCTTDKKICFVCSHGGHLSQLREVARRLRPSHYYWVTYKTNHTVEELGREAHYFIIDPHLSKLKYGINLVQSVLHLARERPQVVLSSGAGIAIPTILVAKYVFRCKIIYVDSAANVSALSRTGSFVYGHADLFLVQWDHLVDIYPNSHYVGLL